MHDDSIVNVDEINIDDCFARYHDEFVPTLIGAGEAAATLGVTKPTLYAYVSRGVVSRQVAVDGRTSLYDRDEIEALAGRRRRRSPGERPSIDVRISTGVTQLHDDSPRYRGHRVLDLLESHRFEDVAELVLSGQLGADDDAWVLDRPTLDHARRIVEAAGAAPPIIMLAVAAMAVGIAQPGHDAADTARRLTMIAPTVIGGPATGSIAERLATAWTRRPAPELVRAVDTALILLVDHELATSTLAVRVAASVRTEPAMAIATGLQTVAGTYHGAASEAAASLFDEAARVGAPAAIERRLADGQRLPGFGHSVYRNGDPRFAPLLERVLEIPGPAARRNVVTDVIAEAGRAIGPSPNVDLALGALYHVGRIPIDAPVFAVARLAGWAAHYEEELAERPVRFRGLARER